MARKTLEAQAPRRSRKLAPDAPHSKEAPCEGPEFFYLLGSDLERRGHRREAIIAYKKAALSVDGNTAQALYVKRYLEFFFEENDAIWGNA